MKVACLGMGWWSDVLADAIKRSGKMQIVACFSRSAEKREAFARKYGCRAARSYEEILNDNGIRFPYSEDIRPIWETGKSAKADKAATEPEEGRKSQALVR